MRWKSMSPVVVVIIIVAVVAVCAGFIIKKRK